MKHAGDILEAFFRMNNISGGEEYVAFFRSWQNIVGVDLASHTRVADIKNHALVVEVDHPGWMQMLHMKKDRILRDIKKRFPQLGVTTVHMKLVQELSTRVPSESAAPASEKAQENHSSGQPRPAGTTDSRGSGGSSDNEAGGSPSSGAPEESSAGAPKPPPSGSDREALEKIEDESFREKLERLRKSIAERDGEA